MTLRRASFGCVLLALGCGSPPPDPSRAAVSLTISSLNNGSTCLPHTSMIEIPTGLAPSAVNNELTCDLSTCNPAVSVAEDGKDGVHVACSVKDVGGGTFNVSVNVDAPGAFAFNAQGQVTPSGGVGFQIGVTNHKDNNGGTDKTCTVTPRVIQGGQIIAAYDCMAFDDPTLGQTPGCEAKGYFLFDRCD